MITKAEKKYKQNTNKKNSRLPEPTVFLYHRHNAQQINEKYSTYIFDLSPNYTTFVIYNRTTTHGS